MSVNIMLLGNTEVGKTTFLHQYIKKTFKEVGMMTVGVDSETVDVIIDNKEKVSTKIWDTAGQEKFQAIFRSHYQKADGMILIYSVVERMTFDKIQEWINSIIDSSKKGITIFLVSNKNDLPDEQKEVTILNFVIIYVYILSTEFNITYKTVRVLIIYIILTLIGYIFFWNNYIY